MIFMKIDEKFRSSVASALQLRELEAGTVTAPLGEVRPDVRVDLHNLRPDQAAQDQGERRVRPRRWAQKTTKWSISEDRRHF